MKQNPSLKQVNERILQLEEEIRRLGNELAVLRSQKLVDELLKADGPIQRENLTVVRTDRGLTIKGSRLTLYSIMDEINENNSLKNVRDIYELTDSEMLDILDYIHLHREEVEKEYQQVLKSAEEHRKYWEEKNHAVIQATYEQRETVLKKLRGMPN
jgi:hypothetical protein